VDQAVVPLDDVLRLGEEGRPEAGRDGFEWALAQGSFSHYESGVHESEQAWRAEQATSPVRAQSDPERYMRLEALPYRSIQGGLSGRPCGAT